MLLEYFILCFLSNVKSKDARERPKGTQPRSLSLSLLAIGPAFLPKVRKHSVPRAHMRSRVYTCVIHTRRQRRTWRSSGSHVRVSGHMYIYKIYTCTYVYLTCAFLLLFSSSLSPCTSARVRVHLRVYRVHITRACVRVYICLRLRLHVRIRIDW